MRQPDRSSLAKALWPASMPESMMAMPTPVPSSVVLRVVSRPPMTEPAGCVRTRSVPVVAVRWATERRGVLALCRRARDDDASVRVPAVGHGGMVGGAVVAGDGRNANGRVGVILQ